MDGVRLRNRRCASCNPGAKQESTCGTGHQDGARGGAGAVLRMSPGWVHWRLLFGTVIEWCTLICVAFVCLLYFNKNAQRRTQQPKALSYPCSARLGAGLFLTLAEDEYISTVFKTKGLQSGETRIPS